MPDEDKQVIIRVPEDLHRRLKVVLARKGVTMQAELAKIVQSYVDHEERSDE